MKRQQWIVLALGTFLMFFGKYLPPVLGLNPIGMATMCIFVATIGMMIGVNLVLPGILCIIAFPANGIYTMTKVLSTTFGNSIVWFILFGTIVIGAMGETGLLRRMALYIITRPITRKNPWIMIGAFFLSSYLVAVLMNLTATVLLFCALCAEMMEKVGIEKGDPFAELMMIGIVVSTLIANGGCAMGHSVPLSGMAYFTEFQGLSIMQYTIVGFLVGFVGLAIMMLIMRFALKMDAGRMANFDATELSKETGPMSAGEKISAVLFVLICLYWALPSVIQNSMPELYQVMNSQLSFVFPMFAAMVLMSIIYIDGKPLMDLPAKFRSVPLVGIWPTAIALFMGSAIQNQDAGIVDAFAASFGPFFSTLSPLVYVGIMCLFVLVMTQFCSNTVTLMVAAIVSTTLMSGGVITGIHGGALSLALAISATGGYATPPAGATAAIIAGQGWVRADHQFKFGCLFGLATWPVAMLAYVIAAAVYAGL